MWVRYCGFVLVCKCSIECYVYLKDLKYGSFFICAFCRNKCWSFSSPVGFMWMSFTLRLWKMFWHLSMLVFIAMFVTLHNLHSPSMCLIECLGSSKLLAFWYDVFVIEILNGMLHAHQMHHCIICTNVIFVIRAWDCVGDTVELDDVKHNVCSRRFFFSNFLFFSWDSYWI